MNGVGIRESALGGRGFGLFFWDCFGVRLVLVAAGTAARICRFKLHPSWVVSASAGFGFRVLLGFVFGPFVRDSRC